MTNYNTNEEQKTLLLTIAFESMNKQRRGALIYKM